MLRDDAAKVSKQFEVVIAAVHDDLRVKLEEQKHRFNLWTSHIGVFAHRRWSLDFRLRKAPEIAAVVKGMMAVLVNQLARLLTFGIEAPSVPGEKPVDQILELKLLRDTLGRLHRLSLAIRRASAISGFARSANFIFPDEQADGHGPKNIESSEQYKASLKEYFRKLLQHKFPKLSEDRIDTLAELSVLRRQKFLYIKDHQAKLSLGSQDAPSREEALESLTHKTDEKSDEGQSASHASTFYVAKYQARPPESISSSQLSANETPDLPPGNGMPSAPTVPSELDEYECPYCYFILPKKHFENTHLWQIHVQQDLQPYICLYERCFSSLTTFTSVGSWNRHMKEQHTRMEWACPFHADSSKVVFESEISLSEHLNTDHGKYLSHSQLRTIVRQAQRVTENNHELFGGCLFCNECDGNKNDPQRNAAHLLDAALLSLPWRDENDLAVKEEDVSSKEEDVSMQSLKNDSNSDSPDYDHSAPEHRTTSKDGERTHLSKEPTMVHPSEGWQWSQEHMDYYYTEVMSDGTRRYIWNKRSQGSEQNPQQKSPYSQSSQYPYHPATYSMADQPNESQKYPHAPQYYPAPAHGFVPQQSYGTSQRLADHITDMAPPVPIDVRSQIPSLITGTPERGTEDPLDPSYKMRVRQEAYQFFKIGRVFSMLWAESASATIAQNATDRDDITFAGIRPEIRRGRYQELIISQIRRYVIVQVRRRRHFVLACPILTYSKRGTLEGGCNPQEHAIAHFIDQEPYYLPGENGMTKDPIAIIPAARAAMHPTSRICLGKTHPIELNIKVKDLGEVHPDHLPKLVQYWEEEKQKVEADL